MFKASDWERVNDTHLIISDANNLQHSFSHESQATLWCAIPAFEELQTTWEKKRDSSRFVLYKEALNRGLEKIGKYYSKFDEKPVYILSLGVFLSLFLTCTHYLHSFTSLLQAGVR